MTITVGDIYTKFPSFRQEDMIKLMNGRTDFTGKDSVSLTNIASYTGTYAKELSIFTAQREGNSFVNMCPEGQRAEISQEINVNKSERGETSNNRGIHQQIPIDTSVFDLAKQREEV